MPERDEKRYLQSKEERNRQKTRLLAHIGFKSKEQFESGSQASARLFNSIAEQYEIERRRWEELEKTERKKLHRRVLSLITGTLHIPAGERRFFELEEFISYHCGNIIELQHAVTRINPLKRRQDYRLFEQMGLTKETARQLLEEMRVGLGFESISDMAKAAGRIQNHANAALARNKKR